MMTSSRCWQAPIGFIVQLTSKNSVRYQWCIFKNSCCFSQARNANTYTYFIQMLISRIPGVPISDVSILYLCFAITLSYLLLARKMCVPCLGLQRRVVSASVEKA